ncbi:GPN-loop GTPase 3 [Populus alba x Populus x berolinensis]|uniref:GPN-loop GTPase 3 n=1 Tax=Populus alba x Populus x berolinensis TaxID=444605 RepID=A0AAD6LVR9_9ROSI|nr:GPN-loop GTPase 3 [Populus alba x Populus x berolinensis]
MGYAQLVIGPAGSGKSTYCSSLYRHCETTGRSINIVNLDPAAEQFDYPVAMDIRELICLDDVMEELGLGPNGALIELEDNLDDWLTDELDNYMDDDYLMDLVTNKRDIGKYLNPQGQVLLSELNQHMAPQFFKLNKALVDLVDQYSMVSFVPLDLRKESSIQYILSQIDNCIQYGEDADVKVKDFDPEDIDD